MEKRRTILVVAFDLNPRQGSEAGRAGLWLKLASRHFPVAVITDAANRRDLSTQSFSRVDFSFVEFSPIYRSLAARLGSAGFLGAHWAFARSARPQVRDLVNKGDIALIHCLTPASLSAHNDYYRFGVPVIAGPLGGGLATPRGFEEAFKGERLQNIARALIYGLIRKLPSWENYFKNCTKIVVGSDYVRGLLPPQIQSRCSLIFDAVVDVDAFSPASQVHRPSGSVTVILYAGRLEPLKGVTLLIDAARRLVQMGKSAFRIELAGSGSLRARLQRLIHTYGLDEKVQLLGELPREAMIAKYRASDIFCFPSLRESGGNVVLEAMACGLPVVVSDYGGPSFSVTDDCGIRIPMCGSTQYASRLADALARLIGDEVLRIRLGQAARARVVQSFSLGALEANIVNLYREFCDA